MPIVRVASSMTEQKLVVHFHSLIAPKFGGIQNVECKSSVVTPPVRSSIASPVKPPYHHALKHTFSRAKAAIFRFQFGKV